VKNSSINFRRFSSQIGHEYVLVPGYDGEKLSLGTGLTSMSAEIRDYVLYHELLHVVGLRHENQRADAGKHITLDFEGIDGIADPGNEAEWCEWRMPFLAELSRILSKKTD